MCICLLSFGKHSVKFKNAFFANKFTKQYYSHFILKKELHTAIVMAVHRNKETTPFVISKYSWHFSNNTDRNQTLRSYLITVAADMFLFPDNAAQSEECAIDPA